jgi:hypothetical protein
MAIGGTIDDGGARLLRYGRDVELSWVYGTEFTAPSAGDLIYEEFVDVDKYGYIYGYDISSTEDNLVLLIWSTGSSNESMLIPLQSKGTTYQTLPIALNEGSPVSYTDSTYGGSDPGYILATLMEKDGSTGSKYQISLLMGEVPRL